MNSIVANCRSSRAMEACAAFKACAFVVLLSFLMLGTQPMRAQTLNVVHAFIGGPSDGAKPQGDLLRDGAGNLYGTTANGGAGNGVIFKVSATGVETILHSFSGADGSQPQAGLLHAGTSYYGTTYAGGASSDGVVFKLTGKTLTVVHSFSGADGAHPAAVVIRDSLGNLYGTTFYGGTAACSCGTIFKIDSTGVESVLYSFTGGSDGKFPAGRLVRDSAGNLYGTASQGGIVNCDNGLHGCGTVFKLTAAGQFSVLYSFGGNADGGQPLAGLVRDGAGNLYGTAFSAGDMSSSCAVQHGCGVVFKVSKTGQQSVLYGFTGSSDGSNPAGDLVRDTAGNLYGTTQYGGNTFGVVFEIPATGGETVLYSFLGGTDGGDSLAGLIRDTSGNLYGTASIGGNADFEEGVVFKLVP